MCSICYDNTDNDKVILTLCMHKFHDQCLNTWTSINNTCPICRRDFTEMGNQVYALLNFFEFFFNLNKSFNYEISKFCRGQFI